MVPLSVDNMPPGQLWLYKHTRSKGTMQLEAMARIQKTALPVLRGFIRASISFLWDLYVIFFSPGPQISQGTTMLLRKVVGEVRRERVGKKTGIKRKRQRKDAVSLSHTLFLFMWRSPLPAFVRGPVLILRHIAFLLTTDVTFTRANRKTHMRYCIFFSLHNE